MLKKFFERLLGKESPEVYYPQYENPAPVAPKQENKPQVINQIPDTYCNQPIVFPEENYIKPPLPKEDADYIIIAVDTSEEMRIFQAYIRNILKEIQQNFNLSFREKTLFKLVLFSGEIITISPKEVEESERIRFSFKPLCRVYDTIMEIGNWLLLNFDDEIVRDDFFSTYNIRDTYFIMISDGLDNSSTNQLTDAMQMMKRLNHKGITTQYIAISKNGILAGAELGFRDVKLSTPIFDN